MILRFSQLVGEKLELRQLSEEKVVYGGVMCGGGGMGEKIKKYITREISAKIERNCTI